MPSFQSKKGRTFHVLKDRNQKEQKYCRADLSSVSDTLTCWVSINVLTRGFLGI